MSHDLIIAITVGQQDLQVLTVAGGRLVRVSPHKKHVGALHRTILAQPECYPLWLPPAGGQLHEERDWEAHFENDAVQVAEAERLAQTGDLQDAAAAGAVKAWLTFGLLWERLRALEHELKHKQVTRPLVLLFHTDRGKEDPHRAGREPVAAAPLLAGWLRSLPLVDVQMVGVLREKERLTEQDEAATSRLSPVVAQRIDEALRMAAGSCTTGMIRLHLAGGIPEVSRVVEASAEFRFDTVQHKSPSEDQPGIRSRKIVAGPTPVEILHARRRVRDLVRQGQIQPAALLASAQAGTVTSAAADRWRRCLETVKLYLAGYRDLACQAADKLGDMPTAQWLKEVLKPDHPNCLLVALRAEAVLRAGDVCEGAAFTFTFLDVAIFDAVERHLQAGSEACVKWAKVCIDPRRLRASSSQLTKFARPLVTALSTRLPCEQKWVDEWVKKWELRIDKAWQKWLLAEAVSQIGKGTTLADSLQELCLGLHDESTPVVLAHFRNMVTHALPPADRAIEKYRQEFVKRQLWQSLGAERLSLLEGPPVTVRVLQGLGVNDPLGLYQQGIAALIADIEDCPLA